MGEKAHLYKGISNIAWGFVFILLGFNIGTFDILPDFVGFIFIICGISRLKDECKTISLLRPIGIILTVYSTAEWITAIFGIDTSWFNNFSVIFTIINIYFTFQLLTDCSLIAKKYQDESRELDKTIIKRRNIYTVCTTVTYLFTRLTFAFNDIPSDVTMIISVILIIISIFVLIITVSALFNLRVIFKDGNSQLYQEDISQQNDGVNSSDTAEEQNKET